MNLNVHSRSGGISGTSNHRNHPTPVFFHRILSLLFIIVMMLSNSVFAQDARIENPVVWEKHDTVATAITALYGDIELLDGTDIITLKAPEIAENIKVVPVGISATIQAKTVAIFQDGTPYATALVFKPSSDDIIDYKFRLDLEKIGAVTLTVVVEALNGDFYQVKQRMTYFICSDGFAGITSGKYAHYNALPTPSKPTHLKIRASVEEDHFMTKLLFSHNNVTFSQAEKTGETVNFIRHIAVKVNQRKVCEVFTGQALTKNPFFQCAVKNRGIKAGDALDVEVTYTDLQGQHRHSDIIKSNDKSRAKESYKIQY
jgi:predicted secreted protein